ncbi:MAG: RIP metalloprotease RseP [Nitrospirae bacterium]|nr:RIP metalloprotease RseP [Nitrospirota bacterium]MCL5237548.1 RIP metalloprotease RseP [Nitrospirota bacterium]
MSILFAILLFGFLIFIHEFGHFVLAKINGVKVLKFSLGFGPKVVSKQIGETEYMLSAIPLGGYVKMLGEDAEEEGEPGDDERSYKNQSVLKRASIVFSGPLFNLLTAVVIFFFIFSTGVPTLLPVVGEVMPDTPAAKAMLLKGDRITEIDGVPVKQWTDMTDIIHNSPNKSLALTVQRNAKPVTISITPESKKVKDLFGEEKEIGLIGVKPSGETVKIKGNVPDSIKNAFLKTWEISVLTIMGIVKLIQRIIPAETIGGPILIFQLAEKQATAGVLNYFFFAAVISINLGVLNLLPIPVLDGGHLLFLGIEAVRRKPLSEKSVLMAQRIGLAIIIMLMVFAMYNDIFRLIRGKPLP